MKVKVFHPDYNEHREVVMKTVKDGGSHHKGLAQSHARITHGGGHNMGIPLQLLQQPECLSPLSLQSLVQLCFIILYLVLLQFFSTCTCASNYACVVEPIIVINMVGYEISDCLLSNSKHVIFKLGIILHTICESKTSAIDVEMRHVSRIYYVCDQSLVHT